VQQARLRVYFGTDEDQAGSKVAPRESGRFQKRQLK